MKAPFFWDAYSDQPGQLKDRAYKKTMRRAQSRSLLKTALSALWLLPAFLALPFLRTRDIASETFVGLGVDPLRAPDKTLEAIERLGVEEILIRIALWEPDRLDDIATFVKRLGRRRVFFVLMQDREHVEDARLRERALRRCFEALAPLGTRFQIGTTINRAKWGFFSVGEYLDFFQTAQKLRDAEFPGIELIGPGVIDFEYHYAAHALFNAKGVRFDAVSALLYVDRRGAPENTQAGCDLVCKTNLLAALAALSPRAKFPLYFTETNWPLTGTAPYAPTSEKECIDEEAHASYLVRYYLLTLATRQVRTVYWHQLAAPGYGLVDTRDGWRERPAFAAMRTLIEQTGQARYLTLHEKRGVYEMFLEKPEGILHILWCNGTRRTRRFPETVTWTDRDGRHVSGSELPVSDAPVYRLERTHPNEKES